MNILLVDPPLELCGRVECLWSLRGNPVGQYSGLPKPYVELIVSLSGEHFWQRDADAKRHRFIEGWLTPIQSGPRFAQTLSDLHLIGARLPVNTAALLFGAGINRDPAIPIPLGELLGSEASRLRERMLECDTDYQRLRCLAGWIVARLNRPQSLRLPSQVELQNLGWKTDALADFLGLSTRGLRKKFNADLGLGPKFWLQLHRFDSVIGEELNAVGLAAAAAEHGYTDQAHMTSEFRRFAGRPPRQYLVSRKGANAPSDAPHYVPGSD